MADGKTKAFDFGALDTAAACDKPFKLEFEHPVTRAPLGCGVMMIGKDSAIAKAHVRKNANEQLRKNAMRSKRGKDSDVPTIEEIESAGTDLLVACTTGIWGDLQVDGEPLAYSPDNVRAFYTRFGWAKEQADETFGNLENFIHA